MILTLEGTCSCPDKQTTVSKRENKKMRILVLFIVANALSMMVMSFIYSGSLKSPNFTHRLLNLRSVREESVNNMSIDEIKSELELRNVNYEDCVSKSQLAQLLIQSREKGKADPSIIDQFNSVKDEDIAKKFDDPDIISQATSKDGTLPGGLSPQMVKAMASDPEIMRLLRDPKMQDVMKSVMTSGPDGIKKYLTDPDAMLLIQRLSKAMAKATNS